MEANIVDLRYKMKDVLKALDNKENVTILYHGKVRGKIIPKKNNQKRSIKNHPFFGMSPDTSSKPVLEELEEIRSTRINDI
jgi:hypothetical protein